MKQENSQFFKFQYMAKVRVVQIANCIKKIVNCKII